MLCIPCANCAKRKPETAKPGITQHYAVDHKRNENAIAAVARLNIPVHPTIPRVNHVWMDCE